MKSEKEEIDRLIEQALTDEEAEFYHTLDEQNLLEMVNGLFQGKMKWLTVMTLVVQMIMFGFAIFFAVKFFGAVELAEMIKFGGAFFFFMMAVGMLKLFHWMQMDKNSLIREIKRMELQVAVLAGRLKKND